MSHWAVLWKYLKRDLISSKNSFTCLLNLEAGGICSTGMLKSSETTPTRSQFTLPGGKLILQEIHVNPTFWKPSFNPPSTTNKFFALSTQSKALSRAQMHAWTSMHRALPSPLRCSHKGIDLWLVRGLRHQRLKQNDGVSTRNQSEDAFGRLWGTKGCGYVPNLWSPNGPACCNRVYAC